MKSVLITGGAGFIGSNFVKWMYNHHPDYKIMVVDALTYAGSIQNAPEGALGSGRYEFWYGDVRNGELMDTLVGQADMVVHMAAESHVTRSIYDNRLFFETDVLGTQTVANAVLKHRKRVERFIHISTSEVYGTAEAAKMSEEHPLKPLSPYASAKCGADRLVYSYWATYDIPAVIVRPFNNYGPSQHLEKAVPRFATSCILGEPLTVHGDGSAARDWLFVEDHCDALDKLLHVDLDKVRGQVLNLGTDVDRSVLEVAKAVLAASGDTKSEIQLISNRPGQVDRHTADSTRARKLLGWEPKTDFETGIARTVEWYRNNRQWWEHQVWMRHIPITLADGTKLMH
jgi:dTDP-glucose 4,6-dehydratase